MQNHTEQVKNTALLNDILTIRKTGNRKRQKSFYLVSIVELLLLICFFITLTNIYLGSAAPFHVRFTVTSLPLREKMPLTDFTNYNNSKLLNCAKKKKEPQNHPLPQEKKKLVLSLMLRKILKLCSGSKTMKAYFLV